MSTTHDVEFGTGPGGEPVPAARLDTIRKLLAKAERAGTPDEAEIYTDKALAMMARHGVDEALLAAGGPPRADPIGSLRIEVEDPYSGAKARLLGWIAVALRCRWVMHDHRHGKVAAVTVFGYASDRERAELLYTGLLLQIAPQVAALRPPGSESVTAFRRSWIYGFAARVHQRLLDAEREVVAEATARRPAEAGPSVALVLADRGDRVDRAYAAEFGPLRRARRPQVSGSGYHRGAAAADRADLGGPTVEAAEAAGRARISPR